MTKRPSLAVSLPSALIQSLHSVKGFDEEAFNKIHQSGEQVTSIRLNPWKSFNVQGSIFNDQLEKVQWSEQGYYLKERPSFTRDPIFHGGGYYVQDASSMFLEEVFRQTVDMSNPLKVLDLCAAPGGKSTLIQTLLTDESLLVSNEVIKGRVNSLTENITKWGVSNVVVTNNDPLHFQRLGAFFDVIVVDAPCSGSGLFRKDSMAVNEWSENNVQLCGQRQQRILADILPALKEGGILIYATCSYSVEEDEAIVDWLMKDILLETCQVDIGKYAGIVETSSGDSNGFGYRFFPDKIKGEGFFIAAFRRPLMEKNEEDSISSSLGGERSRKSLQTVSAKEIAILKPWLKNAEKYIFMGLQEEIIAIPAFMENELKLLQSSLYIKKAGIKMGSVIRGLLIPDHELALSTNISREVPCLDLNIHDSLAYLRREEFKPVTELRGWALVRYEQLPLGWIKIMPGRFNNYYPKNWRILKK